MCSKGWTAPGASWLLCLAAALSAWGAPLLIDRDGVRNAASVIPGGLPAGGVAPGSVIAIHGEGFLPARELRVVIDAGGRQSITTATAAGARDLRAVLPVETEPGFVSVRVLADGRPSNPVSVRVVPAAFGIFTDDDSGGGAAIPGTVLRGQAAVLRGTGLGPAAGGQPPPTEVFVGGKAARVISVGPSGGGMDEVRFVIPADAPRGCHVPLMVRLGGTHPSNWATLRVEPDPGMCENVDRARAALREGGRAGFVVPLHLAMRYQAEPHDRVDFTGDALIAGFRQGHDAAGVGRVLAVPEPGTCTVYTRSLDLAQLSSQLQGEILSKTKKLLGGTLELASGKEKRVVAAPGTEREIYYQTIGGEMPDMAARLPLFLRPGKLRVCSMGTAEVPALQFDLRIPEPVEWTSRDRTAAVDRGKELTIRWETKGRSQPVAIAGISIDKPARAAAAFLCLPERKRTSFRVPVEVLQSLPPSRTQFDQSMGFLFVATLPGLEPPMFNEGGLDALLATGLAVDGRSVQYR